MTLKPDKQRSVKLHDDSDDLEKEEVMSWYKQELTTTTKGHINPLAPEFSFKF
jgi:hypothetical protein